MKQITAYSVELQTDLATAGYYNGAVDGIYGPITLAAVEQLQTDSGLPVTGFVDQATALALEKKLAKASLQTAALQSVLKLLGYYSGPVDGKWTPELTDALKQFQTTSGLEPTGTVDTATMAALQAGNRRAPAVGDNHDDYRGAWHDCGGDHHLAVDHNRGARSPDRDHLTHSDSVKPAEEDADPSWLVRAVPGLLFGGGLVAMAAAMLLAARSGVNAPVAKRVSIGPVDRARGLRDALSEAGGRRH